MAKPFKAQRMRGQTLTDGANAVVDQAQQAVKNAENTLSEAISGEQPAAEVAEIAPTLQHALRVWALINHWHPQF